MQTITPDTQLHVEDQHHPLNGATRVSGASNLHGCMRLAQRERSLADIASRRADPRGIRAFEQETAPCQHLWNPQHSSHLRYIKQCNHKTDGHGKRSRCSSNVGIRFSVSGRDGPLGFNTNGSDDGEGLFAGELEGAELFDGCVALEFEGFCCAFAFLFLSASASRATASFSERADASFSAHACKFRRANTVDRW